ncbi:MAG: hypothetical protein V3S89_10480 [Desulfobacterales bacterium]
MSMSLKEKMDVLGEYVRSAGQKYAYINDLFRNHKRPDPAHDTFKGVARCFFPELLGDTPGEVAEIAAYLQVIEEKVARQMEYIRLLPRKIRLADRGTIDHAYRLVSFSKTTIERRENIDAPAVVCDLSLYAVSTAEVYDLFEAPIIKNNGLTADFDFFEECLEEAGGNAILVARKIPNYVRARICLITERDFSAASDLLAHYRALKENEAAGSLNHAWVVRVIPELEDFILQSRKQQGTIRGNR